MDVDDESRRVGELLQFDFPQPDTRSIRAAAVGGDRQFAGVRVALAPHLVEPATDGGDRELGRIGIDADADEADVGGDVVNAVGHDLAKLLVLEIVDLHALRIALGTIIRAAVLVVADQLLLLRIDRNDRLSGGLALDHMGVDVLELSVAIRMFRTLVGLAVGLPTEAERRQQPPHAGGADLVAHLAQRGGELVVALGYP